MTKDIEQPATPVPSGVRLELAHTKLQLERTVDRCRDLESRLERMDEQHGQLAQAYADLKIKHEAEATQHSRLIAAVERALADLGR